MANFIALLAIGSIIAQTSIAVALPISDKSSSQSPLIGPGSVECETVDKYSVEVRAQSLPIHGFVQIMPGPPADSTFKPVVSRQHQTRIR